MCVFIYDYVCGSVCMYICMCECTYHGPWGLPEEGVRCRRDVDMAVGVGPVLRSLGGAQRVDAAQADAHHEAGDDDDGVYSGRRTEGQYRRQQRRDTHQTERQCHSLVPTEHISCVTHLKR